MSQIQINSFTIPNYHGSGSSAEIRIFANQDFLTSDGVRINKQKPGGSVWYKSITCSVAGAVVTVPSFTIDSNTDSNRPHGTYTAVLYDANGSRKDDVFKKWQVPHDLGVSIGFDDLVNYNEETHIFSDDETYSRTAINALLRKLKKRLFQKVEPSEYISNVDDAVWEDAHSYDLSANQLAEIGDTIEGEFYGDMIRDLGIGTTEVRLAFGNTVLYTGPAESSTTIIQWRLRFKIVRISSNSIRFFTEYKDNFVTAPVIIAHAPISPFIFTNSLNLKTQMRSSTVIDAAMSCKASYVDFTGAA